MDAVNDPEIEKIIMSSAQVGKTELILNTLGYHIDFDPAPIMIIQPTVGLAPMIRDTPVPIQELKIQQFRKKSLLTRLVRIKQMLC